VVGPSAVVLPVVSIYALGRLMLGEVEGAELCFVVKHVKIFIFGVVVDQISQYFFFIMSERTKISIGALLDGVGVMEAEILFVFHLMVVLLDGGVGIGAVVAIGAFLLLLNVRTHFRRKGHVPPSVFGRMIVDTMLVVVVLCDVAGINLENVQIEMLSRPTSTFTFEAVLNW
jgi:hypothetical protein